MPNGKRRNGGTSKFYLEFQRTYSIVFVSQRITPVFGLRQRRAYPRTSARAIYTAARARDPWPGCPGSWGVRTINFDPVTVARPRPSAPVSFTLRCRPYPVSFSVFFLPRSVNAIYIYIHITHIQFLFISLTPAVSRPISFSLVFSSTHSLSHPPLCLSLFPSPSISLSLRSHSFRPFTTISEREMHAFLFRIDIQSRISAAVDEMGARLLYSVAALC